MFHDHRFLIWSRGIIFIALLFITAPALAEPQHCTFCAKSALSEESTDEGPSLGAVTSSGQRCTFCAGVRGGTSAAPSPGSVGAKTIPGSSIMTREPGPPPSRRVRTPRARLARWKVRSEMPASRMSLKTSLDGMGPHARVSRVNSMASSSLVRSSGSERRSSAECGDSPSQMT